MGAGLPQQPRPGKNKKAFSDSFNIDVKSQQSQRVFRSSVTSRSTCSRYAHTHTHTHTHAHTRIHTHTHTESKVISFRRIHAVCILVVCVILYRAVSRLKKTKQKTKQKTTTSQQNHFQGTKSCAFVIPLRVKFVRCSEFRVRGHVVVEIPEFSRFSAPLESFETLG